MDKPNILLIMADQMRGDCLGTAGHPDVKTPYLDSLAAKGTRFLNAYTACPSCIPARAALHTGLSQRSHKRVGYKDGVDWNYQTTLAGELSKAGYHTQCVGKMHVHPYRSLMGFHNVTIHDGYMYYYRTKGMDFYENQKYADDYFYWLKNEKGISADVTDTGVECNSWVARPWIYEEKYHPTNWATDQSIDFLRKRDPKKPFFLMTSYVRPHPPFDAPSCYFDMYRNKDLRKPALGDWVDEETFKTKGRVYDSDTGPADEELMKEAQIGYYACITHMDHQIGRLIHALMEHDVYDNTVIVFCSDHGELLGDHHTYRKVRPYQGSVNIPFIVSGPEHLIGKNPPVRDDIIELRDVLPSLLDIADHEIPESIEGESFILAMRKNEPGKRNYLHGEHSRGAISNHYIVTKTDKFIWYSQTGEQQYFKLDNDPLELKNLINSDIDKNRIDELRGYLIHELTGREEGYTDGVDLIAGKQPKSVLD